MAKISLIAAVAENGIIGRDGALPWRIKSELQYFKDATIGKPVIHGRKSFESLGAPLPDRANIVITRDANYNDEGILVTDSLEKAFAMAQDIAQQTGQDEIMIAGGAEIYRISLPLADKLYLTEIHLSPEGDTKFPAFDRGDWMETKREFHAAQKGESADYTITVLERRAKP